MLTRVVEIFYDRVQDRYSIRESQINLDQVEFTRPNRRIVLAESAVPTGLNTSQGFTDIHFRSGDQVTIVGGMEKLNTKQLLKG
jgi:hypothetical protein